MASWVGRRTRESRPAIVGGAVSGRRRSAPHVLARLSMERGARWGAFPGADETTGMEMLLPGAVRRCPMQRATS